MRELHFQCAAIFGALAIFMGAPASAATLRDGAGEAEIEAWIAANVEPAGEMRGVTFDDAVEYYDPRRLEKLADGHLVVPFRLEHWRPQREGRTSWRSERQRVELDCQGLRARFLSRDGFPENNLKGRATPLTVDAEWLPPPSPDSVDGQEILQACSFASLVGSADWEKAVPPPPSDEADEATLEAWRVRHIDVGDHALLTSDRGAFYFLAPESVERTKEGWVKARLREEFAVPAVLQGTAIRSYLATYEFNCEKWAYRISDHVAFPGLNMLGTPYAELEESDEWSMAVAGGVDARLGRALCRLAAAPKTIVEDAAMPEGAPRPSAMNAAGIRAWANRYLNMNSYALARPNAVGMQLYSPSDLTLLPNGNVTVITRMETFAPQTVGSSVVRSGLFLTEFDCRRPRNRVIKMVVYEDQNLEGKSQDLEGADWRSFDQNPDGAALRDLFCAQRELLDPEIDPALALTPNPRSTSDEDVADWLGWYVEPRDDVYVGNASGAAGFFSKVEGEQTPQGHIRVWTRLEFFDPSLDAGKLGRSVRSLMDFDCQEGRTRALRVEVYPGANLTGKKRDLPTDDIEWTYPSPNSMGSILTNAVCSFDGENDGSTSEPRLPARDAKTPI